MYSMAITCVFNKLWGNATYDPCPVPGCLEEVFTSCPDHSRCLKLSTCDHGGACLGILRDEKCPHSAAQCTIHCQRCLCEIDTKACGSSPRTCNECSGCLFRNNTGVQCQEQNCTLTSHQWCSLVHRPGHIHGFSFNEAGACTKCIRRSAAESEYYDHMSDWGKGEPVHWFDVVSDEER